MFMKSPNLELKGGGEGHDAMEMFEV